MKKFQWIRITLVLLVLAFIWGNSLLPAENSAELSGLVGRLLNVFFRGIQSALSGLGFSLEFSTVVRKTAHFSEYAALGFLSGWAFMRRDCHVRLFVSAPLCAAASLIDEFVIQRFTDGRSPGLKDVLIDCSGALLGILLVMLICCIVRLCRKKPGGA